MLRKLFQQLRDAEQADSGPVRTRRCATRAISSLPLRVVFESEEKARAREDDQRRAEGLAAARATMAEVFDGAPSFADMIVIEEFAL